MRITAELSLYPLSGDVIPKVLEFIGDLESAPELELTVNQMSTQLRGELHTVLAVVERALARAFDSGEPSVLVAKFLNADLPIREAPALE